jgi:hypothetical protein
VVGDVTAKVIYRTYSAYASTAAKRGTKQYVLFETENGGFHLFYGVVAGVSPITGAQDKAAVGEIKFVFSHVIDEGSIT